MLIVGKILLILLGIIIMLVLLVLFFPIGYKVYLKRGTEGVTAKVQGAWLLGLLRFLYSYPRPGDFRVKLAFITLYRSSGTKQKKNSAAKAAENKGEKPDEIKKEQVRSAERENPAEGLKTALQEERRHDGDRQEETAKDFGENGNKAGKKRTISAKLEKIKCTIETICDIIKNIFENIAFYKELLEKKETKEVLLYGGRRIGNILKHIKPRSLKAELLIGTGSPDTTGYLLAGYGILLPWIGRPEDISLTADFEQAVLEGSVRARGHITLFHILKNGVFLLMDKRIRRLYEKIKKHGREKTLAAN